MQYDVLDNDITAWAAAPGLALFTNKRSLITRALITRLLVEKRAAARHTATGLDDLAVTVLTTTHALQQAIDDAPFDRFEAAGIGFAYPAQAVHTATPGLTLHRSREKPTRKLPEPVHATA